MTQVCYAPPPCNGIGGGIPVDRGTCTKDMASIDDVREAERMYLDEDIS